MQSDSEYQPSRKYDSEIDSWDEEQKALTGHRCGNGFNLRSDFDDDRRNAATAANKNSKLGNTAVANGGQVFSSPI